MSSSQPAPLSEPSESPEPAAPVLYHERGASWYWVLAGPVAATTMLMIQHSSGYGYQPLMPLIFLVTVSGFVGLQVKAARIHTSLDLTERTLRQGTETIRVGDIIKIYPAAERNEEPDWQQYRALGELSGVPRGRTGMGIRLTGSRSAQAWARSHRRFREVLTPLVVERTQPADDGDADDDETGSARW